MATKDKTTEDRAAQLLSDVPGTVDTKLEEDGEWFTHASSDRPEVGPNEVDGFQSLLLDEKGNGFRGVMVSSRHTSAFLRDAQNVSRRALRMGENERIRFEEEMQNTLQAKHCVRGWDFTDRQGNAIPCDRDLVEAIFSMPRFRHHKGFIIVALAKHEGLIKRIQQADAGN